MKDITVLQQRMFNAMRNVCTIQTSVLLVLAKAAAVEAMKETK